MQDLWYEKDDSVSGKGDFEKGSTYLDVYGCSDWI